MLSLSALVRRRSALDASVREPRLPFSPTARPRIPGRYRLPWLLALAGTVVLGLSAARGDVQEGKQRGSLPAQQVRNAPASAVSTGGEIDPGEQIEITLTAHGGGNRAIAFTFADQPRHGLLTGFRPTSRNTAVVTYVHDARTGPGHDQFTYQVQASGTAKSGPVTVDIDIHEYPPRLAASPAELDFGAVDVGQEGHAMLTLRNDGGGTAVGRLEPPEPWTVNGNAEFRLAAGEKQAFQLIFRPTRGRSFSEAIRVGDYANGSQRPANLHLLGTGLGMDLPDERQYAGINGAPPLPLDPAATVVSGILRSGGLAGEPVEAPARPGLAANGTGGTGKPAIPGERADAGRTSGNGAGNGTTAGPGFEAPLMGANEVGVKVVQERSHGRTNLELAWKQPEPLPSKYRVELRYLSLDQEDNLKIDWLPYAKVEYRTGDGQVVANLRDLPAGTNQSIQVVAIDGQGRAAVPSGILQVQLDPALKWWRLSLVQWMLLILAALAVLIVRRHLQDRRTVAQLGLDRVARQRAEA